MTGQRPLELILARNLLASLSTPAFLVDGEGEIAFYNEAAGALLQHGDPVPARPYAHPEGVGDDERQRRGAQRRRSQPQHGHHRDEDPDRGADHRQPGDDR